MGWDPDSNFKLQSMSPNCYIIIVKNGNNLAAFTALVVFLAIFFGNFDKKNGKT